MTDSGDVDESADSEEQAADEMPPADEITRRRYDVYVQWSRGEPHQHEESIRASDVDTALMLAKRNVDVRLEPVSLRVVPRAATAMTQLEDPTVTPSTDRAYRDVAGYFTKDVDPPNARE